MTSTIYLLFLGGLPAVFSVLSGEGATVTWQEQGQVGAGPIEAKIEAPAGLSSIGLAFPCLSSDHHSKNGQRKYPNIIIAFGISTIHAKRSADLPTLSILLLSLTCSFFHPIFRPGKRRSSAHLVAPRRLGQSTGQRLHKGDQDTSGKFQMVSFNLK